MRTLEGVRLAEGSQDRPDRRAHEARLQETPLSDLHTLPPTRAASARKVFDFDAPLEAFAFGQRDDHVPALDTAHRFNPDVTRALLAGFARNKRVMLQGLHGTGRSARTSSRWGRA